MRPRACEGEQVYLRSCSPILSPPGCVLFWNGHAEGWDIRRQIAWAFHGTTFCFTRPARLPVCLHFESWKRSHEHLRYVLWRNILEASLLNWFVVRWIDASSIYSSTHVALNYILSLRPRSHATKHDHIRRLFVYCSGLWLGSRWSDNSNSRAF